MADINIFKLHAYFPGLNLCPSNHDSAQQAAQDIRTCNNTPVISPEQNDIAINNIILFTDGINLQFADHITDDYIAISDNDRSMAKWCRIETAFAK